MNIVSFCVIGMGLFVGIIALLFKKACYNQAKALWIAFTLLVIGFGTLIASSMLNEKEQYQMWCILLGMLFIWLSYTLIRDVYRCNVKIFAKCTKINSYSGGRGSRRYAPVFQYSYQGKDYVQQTSQSFSHEDSSLLNQTCPVYIWDKKPDHVICRKKVEFMDVFMGIMGLIFVIVAIFM